MILKIKDSVRRVVFLAAQVVLSRTRFLLGFLCFRQRCILCGSDTVDVLCHKCRTGLSVEAGSAVINRKRCSICGRPLLSEQNICTACRKTDAEPVLAGLDGVFPLFPYVLSKKKLLYSWKIARKRSLSPLFAAWLFNAWKEHFSGIPVVPVPPRPGKIRKTGWDQIEDLSRWLLYRYHVPVRKLLSRTEVQQQKKLSREARLEHTDSAYRLRKSIQEPLPESVVLLDDVITTGSTIRSCAAHLKAAGVSNVYALALFTVPG